MRWEIEKSHPPGEIRATETGLRCVGVGKDHRGEIPQRSAAVTFATMIQSPERLFFFLFLQHGVRDDATDAASARRDRNGESETYENRSPVFRAAISPGGRRARRLVGHHAIIAS